MIKFGQAFANTLCRLLTYCLYLHSPSKADLSGLPRYLKTIWTMNLKIVHFVQILPVQNNAHMRPSTK